MLLAFQIVHYFENETSSVSCSRSMPCNQALSRNTARERFNNPPVEEAFLELKDGI
jgi:hypothetical protein